VGGIVSSEKLRIGERGINGFEVLEWEARNEGLEVTTELVDSVRSRELDELVKYESLDTPGEEDFLDADSCKKRESRLRYGFEWI
jgi:hypothetical protein